MSPRINPVNVAVPYLISGRGNCWALTCEAIASKPTKNSERVFFNSMVNRIDKSRIADTHIMSANSFLFIYTYEVKSQPLSRFQ